MISFPLVKTIEGIFDPIQNDIDELNDRLINRISPDSHSLCSILQGIFEAGGKRLRPAISFLLFRALRFAGREELYSDSEDKLFLVTEIAELTLQVWFTTILSITLLSDEEHQLLIVSGIMQ